MSASMVAPWGDRRFGIGTWSKLPVPELMEVVRFAGYDFVVIDLEHGLHDARSMALGVLAAQSVGLRAFVRVLGHSVAELQGALDAGADGVFVPHVDSRRTAEAVVAACRFAPRGSRRGSPTTRFGGWSTSTQEELVGAGDTLTVIAQVESPAAVAAIDDIVAVDGIDALFIGTYDLSLSSGVDSASPQFASHIETVERAASGVLALGSPAVDGVDAARLAEGGYRFAMVGSDVTFLGEGARRGLQGRPQRGRSDE
ncbi:aldolase/citrate lyase family protein [Herbiconiux sp. KACC 21604]|uniref:HpcH/HpaI aldolase family protein n=1 Tax=unclassified Herbiconiux TaxID=2618217 RepID=UPI001491C0D4|nr:aldolase/citrate lyase family protein [Herbiconiux sp. SALV-R1]QJU55299.1 hypothetical protein HL652_17860 [Herbiconiux sp. SALV-R1]WPO86466.1 aldolase/citrate lyase family protein [Herbiconiux sp. KACC 21604]